MDNAQYDRSTELVRYLDKEMNNDEQLAFEEELAANEQLRTELDGLRAARQSIILYGLKEQLSRIHREERGMAAKETPVIKMTARRKFTWYAIAAAACLVLIFLAVDRYNSVPDANKLFAEQYTRFEPSNTRGDSFEISLIEKLYVEKKYDAVIRMYSSIGPQTPKEMIMAGTAWLETGHPDVAAKIFQAVLDRNRSAGTTAFNDEANYYLALSYLKNEDYSPAIGLMEKIHDDKENAYSEKFSVPYIDRVKRLRSK